VSQRLGVEMEEAASFIESYYAQFPGVREYLAAQVERAKIDGFTTTMFGRRRYLPELHSANFRLRALGERMALNTPIQGTAADIIKRAMIDVDTALRSDPIAKMLLTVHDELVFEIPEEKLERARADRKSDGQRRRAALRACRRCAHRRELGRCARIRSQKPKVKRNRLKFQVTIKPIQRSR